MFTIKVLMIGGNDNFFAEAIFDKMQKERCSLYHITGKKAPDDSKKTKRIVTYNLELDDEYIPVVIKSIMPDVVIFMGAFDDRYFWKDYYRCSARYMCDLTNILVSASDLGTKKFIYLSTVNVYGFDNEGLIDEETPIAPSNVKSIIVAQGERLCKDFSDSGKINAISLRFGIIYGNARFQNMGSDYVMKKCFDALVDRKMTVNNQVLPLISTSDAAIAVYKASYLKGESGIYNVCDNETISDAQVADVILTEYLDYDIEILANESFKPQDYSIDGSKFNQQYAFFQKVDYKEGIQTLARFVRKNQYRLYKNKNTDEREDSEKTKLMFYVKFLGNKMLPFFESLLMFALFLLCSYVFQRNGYLQSIDVMILYVIIVSITFGKQQALISSLLAAVYWVIDSNLGGESVLTILIGYEFAVRLIFLFITGMIVGHTRDRLHQKLAESRERIEYMQNEYQKLDEINDITVSVKHELEERIISYGDSMAKNYLIIEQIDSLIPLKSYIESLDVICTVLKTTTAGIFLKNSSSHDFKLNFWSNKQARDFGLSMDEAKIDSLLKNFSKNEIFVNKQFDKDFPIFAAPIRVDDEMEAIIMVWDIKFEGLTMHQINLFNTLVKIINRAIINATYYRRSLEEQFAIKYQIQDNRFSLYFLSEDEFMEAYEIAKKAKKKHDIPYSALRINLENMTVRGAITHIKPMLTGSYYMYKGEKYLEILLSGSSGESVDEHLKTTVDESNVRTENKHLVATKLNVPEKDS